MAHVEYLPNKAGSRLVDLMVDAPQIDIVVTAPGMLFYRFEFLMDQSALGGCYAGFYCGQFQELERVIL